MHIIRRDIMQIIQKKLADIVPYANNTKKHDETQIKNVAESIKKYGWVQPIVIDNDGTIVIGHCRALAAEKLGMEEVPCVVVSDLTEEEINALRIVDNKTNESPWDFDLLSAELPEIDLSDFEFDFGIEDEEKTEIVEDEAPEVEFSEILGEENNYLVLQFKTDIDWLNAQSIFGLETVKSYSTRKDGKVTKNMERKGVARVLDGAKVLNELLGDKI